MAEAVAISTAGLPRPTATLSRIGARRQDFAQVLAQARQSRADSPAAEPETASPAPEETAVAQPEEDGASPAPEETGAAVQGEAGEEAGVAIAFLVQPEEQEEAQPLPEPADQEKAAAGAQVLAEVALSLAGLPGAEPDKSGQRTAAVEKPVAVGLAALEKGASKEGKARTEGPAPAPEQDRGSTSTPADLPPELLLPRQEVPAERNSFDLLKFSELMDPQLKVETGPQPLLDRLQQAVELQTGSPLLDRLAETTLPQVVRGLVTLAREGVAEMRLQLEPPDLGQIELRVKTAEGVVRSELLVQHPQVKHLLDSQVERLRSSLADQGLALQGFDVGVARDGRFGQQDQAWQGPENRGGSAWQPASPEESGSPEVETALRQNGQHEVDYLV